MSLGDGYCNNFEGTAASVRKDVVSSAAETDGECLLGDMRRFRRVRDVARLLRSSTTTSMVQRLKEYQHCGASKNTITKDDPEHSFLMECSQLVWKIEIEKTKVHKFVQDHFVVRFRELSFLIPEAVLFSKLVKLISNQTMLDDGTVLELDELLPSQITVVLIAAASTSQGPQLEELELAAIVEACDEMATLEEAKQMFLEYIQLRMVLVAPNLCAFLGSGITSQMFALCESLAKISSLSPTELEKLGAARRQNHSGIDLHTVGFLSNCELVANHPPEMRPKALRLVSNHAVDLARIDDNRRAPDDSLGIQAREYVKNKMMQWSDPAGYKGNSNTTYQRKGRSATSRIGGKRDRRNNDDD